MMVEDAGFVDTAAAIAEGVQATTGPIACHVTAAAVGTAAVASIVVV